MFVTPQGSVSGRPAPPFNALGPTPVVAPQPVQPVIRERERRRRPERGGPGRKRQAPREERDLTQADPLERTIDEYADACPCVPERRRG